MMQKVNFLYTDELLVLNNIFNKENGEYQDNLRIVGGTVRNFLLNKEINDFDLSTKFSPKETMKILKKHNIKAIPTGIKFGTITAIINNKTFEITSTREDIKTDGRHAEVKFIKDFEIDSNRRDFTFNALYLDFNNNLFDYHNGIEDLKKGKIKFIGDAEKRIQEDYLRILRFFRFFCYYGIFLDINGLKYSIQYKDKLNLISGERIKTEMFKILVSNYSIYTLSKMQIYGILEVVTNIKKFDFLNLQYLYSIKKYINTEISAELALSLLLNNIDELNILKDKWKLSKKENKKIFNLLQHKNDNLYNNKNIKELLFYNNKDFVKELLIFNAVLNCKNQPQNHINNLLIFINNTEIPRFPLSGKDLENIGITNKQYYTEILSNLTKDFINSDFKLTKKELLNKIKK